MLFDKIIRFISRKGGDMIIFIISLLLAFFMWSIQKLSQEYSSFLKYYISINTIIPGYSQNSTSDDVLVLRGKATGFYILKHSYTSSHNRVIDVNIDPKFIHKYKDKQNKFFVKSADIKNKIQESLGSDLALEAFTTDTLFFNLNKQMYKKVPVYANTSLSYKQQYMPFSKVQQKPDSVLIYGNSNVIDSVDSISTSLISGSKSSHNINGIIRLKEIQGVDIPVKAIYYSRDFGSSI